MNDLNLISRYQQFMLFGGGIALSVVVLFATGMLLYGAVKGYIEERRDVFMAHKALVQLEVESAQTSMRRTVVNTELLWTGGRPAQRATAAEFAAHGQAVVQPNRDVVPVLAISVQPELQDEAFERYLSVAEQQAFSFTAIERQRQSHHFRVGGYVYSPDRKFATIMPAPLGGLDTLLHRTGAQDAAELIEWLSFDFSALSNRDDASVWSSSRRIVWHGPMRDPLTGGDVFRMVEPAFHEGRPIMVFVNNLPADVLADHLKNAPQDAVAMLVDRTGRVVLREDRTRASVDGDALMQQSLDSGSWHRGFSRLDDSYRQGVFSVSNRIADTDWVMVYAYSWKTIAIALWPEALRYLGTTLLTLAALWAFIAFFHHRVFAPVVARSQRVFESEHMNRAIIATSPVGIALVSLESGALLLQNMMMEQYAGARDGMGQPASHALLQLHRKQAGHSAVQLGCELTLRKANGSACDLLVNFVRTRYRGRSALLCTIADITVRKAEEREMEAARQAADQASRAKSMLLATMTHEIRTPLNAMLGNLELLEKAPDANQQQARLQAVTTASRGLLHTIDNILDMIKAEAGRMTLESVRFRLAELVREMASMYAPGAAAKGLALHCKVADNLAPLYYGDPVRLKQLIGNLLGNAIKFTDTGFVALEVYVAPEGSAGSPVVIQVRDTGIGIAPEHLGHLFEAFTQADASIAGRFGGTGIGLALCKKIAQAVGGDIEVESAPGAGSTFKAMLPLQPEAEPADAAHTEQRGHRAAQPLRVLAVDDHPVNRKLLQDQLHVLGYEADIASSVQEALTRFDRHALVITDLQMPPSDGCTLARALRERDPNVPIIAASAQVGDDEQQRCAQAGINEVLQKPVLLTLLDHTLRRYLGGKDRGARSNVANVPHRGPLSEELRQALMDGLAKTEQNVHAALARGNLQAVADELHAARGAFAVARMPQLTDECAQLERMAEAGEVLPLKNAFDAVVAQAREQLDEGRCNPL
ncbi:ATP-binding protein [Burkholderia multivorans]|uniref:hybrid sensor histidine kinase/response regulator n=1 Tax=Burkholderia multivorans TaxID=87883 RepID=UPI002018DA8F|nr:ATP-binding protein [Burkholderia multivorans]MCO1370223.1 ATP-binding protein [Burkholderia multivorans]MCO1459522.1 ATP-binding protein [Burkholderia multivorans]MCO1467513.1 ATP-binding protein [Burkholderia multivorans]MDN7449046.1 ATP-binding protein [Burkholderia multivorans]UQO20725.1 ATP-binding protein [Burkholderia multivorans]